MDCFAKDDFRNIFTTTLKDYPETKSLDKYYENKFIYKLNNTFSVILGYSLDSRENWQNNIFSGGSIIVYSRGIYSEVSYSRAFDSNNSYGNIIYFDINDENITNLILSTGYKLINYPDINVHIFSPAVTYQFASKFNYMIKYFWSIDTQKAIGYSLWSELKYDFLDLFTFLIGGTIGARTIDNKEIQQSQIDKFYSTILGVNHYIEDKIVIKFNFEKYTKINFYVRNSYTFIIDIKF